MPDTLVSNLSKMPSFSYRSPENIFHLFSIRLVEIYIRKNTHYFIENKSAIFSKKKVQKIKKTYIISSGDARGSESF